MKEIKIKNCDGQYIIQVNFSTLACMWDNPHESVIVKVPETEKNNICTMIATSSDGTVLNTEIIPASGIFQITNVYTTVPKVFIGFRFTNLSNYDKGTGVCCLKNKYAQKPSHFHVEEQSAPIDLEYYRQYGFVRCEFENGSLKYFNSADEIVYQTAINIGNATILLKQGDRVVGSFTTNQNTNNIIEIDDFQPQIDLIESNKVDKSELTDYVSKDTKINGKSLERDISLTASDVGALDDGIEFVSSVNGQSGEVVGIQSEITSSNKLNSDLISDENQTNKFVTLSEKNQIETNTNNISTIQNQYLKNAIISDNTLIITKQDGSTINFQDGGINSVSWGEILGTISNQSDLQSALGLKVNASANAISSDVESKSSTSKFLTPANVDKIVKSGLINNTETLSDNDLESIHSWLGVGTLKGNGAPTEYTEGDRGTFYLDTSNSELYICIDISPDRTLFDWAKVVNKTTTIDSSSTNAQVPTAKAVYDIVGNIETLLEAL